MSSILPEESRLMEVHRRIEVQTKLGRRTGVRVNSKQDPQMTELLENYQEERSLDFVSQHEEHELLADLQFLDGYNPNMNIDPRINPNAKAELDNLRNELQHKHNLKLGLTNSKKWEPPTPY